MQLVVDKHAAYCLEMDSNTQICNGSNSAAKKLVYYMYLIKHAMRKLLLRLV